MAWALDSMFLILDDQSQNPLLGNYKAHGVLGYDVSSQQFILSIFNNSGDRPIYKGGFTGDTLVLITHVPMPKRPFDQKILWYKSGSAVKLQILLDSGKGYALVIDETETPMPPPIK
jgi:hypothetical protein